MKKRTSTIIGALVVLCLATSCFVGSTFAKYTSGNNGTTDVARIAKWSFEVGDDTTDKDITSPTYTFDLKETVIADNTDASANVIAPGTSGTYSFTVKNSSEVDATFSFTLTNSLNPTVADTVFPLVITSVTATNSVTFADAQISADGIYTYTSGESSVLDPDAETVITVSWNWPIGANDANDTKIGIAAQTDLNWNVTLTITATQSDNDPV